ncbi:MAG: DUF4465 domain-containing protein [bacterium]
MKRMLIVCVSLVCMMGIVSAYAGTITFEDLSLPAESYWDGSDSSGGFTSGEAFFPNNYDTTWGSWDGFAYSNRSDTELRGMDAQFNAIAGEGVNQSSNYVVVYVNAFADTLPTITFSEETELEGAYVTNSNYTYYSLLEGDMFAKKFEEGDWFMLTITGRDTEGNSAGDVEFLLAENSDIVDSWVWVDLSDLGSVTSIEFALSSSDTGEWGMNTPAYFCMDNVTSAEEREASSPTTTDSFVYSYGIYPFYYPSYTSANAYSLLGIYTPSINYRDRYTSMGNSYSGAFYDSYSYYNKNNTTIWNPSTDAWWRLPYTNYFYQPFGNYYSQQQDTVTNYHSYYNTYFSMLAGY